MGDEKFSGSICILMRLEIVLANVVQQPHCILGYTVELHFLDKIFSCFWRSMLDNLGRLRCDDCKPPITRIFGQKTQSMDHIFV